MEANKTQPGGDSVDAFIDGIPNEMRRADSRVLATLMREVTGDAPVMWGSSIVGYGSEHYRYESGREGDMPVVSFSPRAAALTIYSVIDNEEGRGLLDQLGPHTTGKGCLYIKDLSQLDIDVLREMLTAAVEAKTQR